MIPIDFYIFQRGGSTTTYTWPSAAFVGPKAPGVYEPAFAFATCPEGNTDPTHLVSFEAWQCQKLGVAGADLFQKRN